MVSDSPMEPAAWTNPDSTQQKSARCRAPSRALPTESGNHFAHLKADETADGDFITQLSADLGNVFFHADFGVTLHEALVHEAVGLEEFIQHAGEDFFHGGGRLAFQAVRLRGDFALLRDHLGSHLLTGNRV